MKRIKIDKRDVYRAKHDIITDEKSIFYESYKKAATVLNEIISDSKKIYLDFHLGKSRMTNNIILFNGERGYGKTTALQSFSDFLEKPENETDPIFEFDVTFLCIDTIDPSCMNSNESVVRVVLTYLFSLVMPKLKQIKADDYRANMLKVEVLENFQRCYDFIDYLCGSRKNMDFIPDDIEYISKLGNSHELKKEIWSLLQNVIGIITNDKENTFLILKIDDADLSTSSTFKLCDEIRSYFSLPNLVIIMAGDLKHLKDNIYEEYISESNYVSKLSEDYINDRYNLMAVRYVEKMFPQGHVIQLPQIDELLLNHNTNLMLEYIGDRDIKEEISGNNNEDIQNQLLRQIYEKTGIVLIRSENKLHIFLPHTMRELTHFVKMIYEMKDINYKYILKSYSKNRALNSTARKQLEIARENLNALNQYFIDYWCAINLTEWDVKQIRKMHLMEQKTSKYAFMKNANMSIAEYILEMDLSEEKRKMAYIMFYSIHNFIKLYDLLINQDLMKNFIDFSCCEFDFIKKLVNTVEDDVNNDYHVLSYEVSNDLLSESLDKSIVSLIHSTEMFYNMFCNMKKTGEKGFKVLDDKIIITKTTETLNFDLLKSLKRLLYNYFWQKEENKGIGENSNRLESELGVLDIKGLNDYKIKVYENEQDHETHELLISSDDLYILCIYICNIELQRYVNEQISNCVKKISNKTDLIQIYEEILNSFDRSLNSLLYTNIISNVGSEIAKAFIDHEQVVCNLFFSNKCNLKKIIKEYVKIIDENISTIQKFTSKEHILEITKSKFDSFEEQLKWEPDIIRFITLNENIHLTT